MKKECERAFENADCEQKGWLSREDYKVAVLSLLGCKPSGFEVERVWKNHNICQNHHQGLGKEAFTELMAEKLRNMDSDELARQVFLSFDAHHQGFISMETFKKAVWSVLPSFPEERAEQLFVEVDTNCDGRVSYGDFQLLMKHFQLSHVHCQDQHLVSKR